MLSDCRLGLMCMRSTCGIGETHFLDCWLNMFYPWHDLIEFVCLYIICVPHLLEEACVAGLSIDSPKPGHFQVCVKCFHVICVIT